jgi:hypothetical protein
MERFDRVVAAQIVCLRSSILSSLGRRTSFPLRMTQEAEAVLSLPHFGFLRT